MGRNFDGTNDRLVTADNALTGLDVAINSLSCWADVTAINDCLLSTMSADGAGNFRAQITSIAPTTSGFKLSFTANASTTDGVWDSTDDIAFGVHHIVTTYDRSSDANNPVMYIDGASVGVTTTTTPVAVQTGSDTLKMGETDGNSSDFTGRLGWVVAHGGVTWDAATVNRAKWWGRPRGGFHAYYSHVTTKLLNEATANAPLTAVGTTGTSFLPPVIRPGSALMGMGVGW